MRLEASTTEFDPARSAQMARVRSRDTGPEIRVRRALHAAGLRFRLHDKHLPGKPDITLPSRRIAIFVHGCFWHRHPDPDCRLTRTPKSRIEFWTAKFAANQARDERNLAALTAAHWTVMTIWECELGEQAILAKLVADCLNRPVRCRTRTAMRGILPK